MRQDSFTHLDKLSRIAYINSVPSVATRDAARDSQSAWTNIETALHEALLDGASPIDLIGRAAGHLREVLGCSRVCVVAFDFERRQAEVQAVVAERVTSVARGAVFPLAGRPPRLRAPRIIGNGLRSSDPIVQALAQEGYRAFLTTPLIVRGQLVGALNAATEDRWRWKPWQVEQVRRASDSIAMYLSAAWLVDGLHQRGHQVERVSQRLLLMLDAERRHIGRELHDDLGQLLTGLLFSIPSPPDASPELTLRLRRLEEIAREALDRVRTLALRVREPLLETARLRVLLAEYVLEFTARTGVRVDFLASASVDRVDLGLDRRTCVYRVLQESLTNVAKHAQVQMATVSLAVVDRTLEMRVSDRGRGFDPSRSDAGLGLANMTERAQLVGGVFQVVSAPGEGTRTLLRVPVHEC